MVSDVTFSNLAQESQETRQQSISLSQDLDDFLKLLTVQLQNQDPLNPMDNDKLTDQITQFSQVEQQINTNQKLDDLLALELAGISSIALGYVGLDASYVSAEMPYDGETPVKISYALGGEAAQTTVNIYDEAGSLIYSEEGPVSAGQHEFVWTGRVGQEGNQLAEAGTYTVSIDSFDAGGNSIDSSTIVTGRVRGIENQNGIIFLLVGERAVPISNVISASEPDSQLTPAVTSTGNSAVEILESDPNDNDSTSDQGGDSA